MTMLNQFNDPIQLFSEWFHEAQQSITVNPEAVALATATSQGKPSVRIVLLKKFNEDGFVFYTNLNSRKGQELSDNPYAALCFYWPHIDKQIRVEGKIKPVSENEADDYFASRPRESKIVAWASKQSKPMASLEELNQRYHEYREEFKTEEVPRPPFWSGYRLIPNAIEFWTSGEYRLHKRIAYTKTEEGNWQHQYLYP